jgi:hypothetical protein
MNHPIFCLTSLLLFCLPVYIFKKYFIHQTILAYFLAKMKCAGSRRPKFLNMIFFIIQSILVC